VPDRTITTRDGRDLRVREEGDPDGYPVVYHHGTPGSRELFGPWVDDAKRRGIRLIGYDRPGYGGSTPRPGRKVADVAADVEAIADELGLDSIATWGISGGGPHALACAALLAERVAAAAALASVAPYDADGLHWLGGMGESNVDEFRAALEGRPALERWMDVHLPEIREADSEAVADALRSLLTPVDAAALSGELASFFVSSIRTGIAERADGWIDDDLAFVASWDFGLADITVPLVVWQGDHDLFVPPAHGAWLAAHLPQAETHLSAEDGHITLAERRVSEVHAWLLDRATR
jgi:pimeloyl-ACP methyl ester carboxylesterase